MSAVLFIWLSQDRSVWNKTLCNSCQPESAENCHNNELLVKYAHATWTYGERDVLCIFCVISVTQNITDKLEENLLLQNLSSEKSP